MQRLTRALTLLPTLPILLAVLALAAPSAARAGPPFPEPVEGQLVYDPANALDASTEQVAGSVLADVAARTGADVALYVQVKPASNTAADTQADGRALLDEWALGGPEGNALVLFVDLRSRREPGQAQLVTGAAFADRWLPEAERVRIQRNVMLPALRRGRLGSGIVAGLRAVSRQTEGAAAPSARPSTSPSGSPASGPSDAGATPAPAPSGSPLPTPVPVRPGVIPPAGPPYPAPVEGQVVYDYADILDESTIAEATGVIERIEERTAAEVVVYTQIKPQSDTEDEAEQDARALIDQWGVGRRGFDDGLAILFDMDASRCHGQVQLYAAPGYAAAYLTNAERQAIFDQEMRPALERCDLDGAVLAALSRVDQAATPEHAQALASARQADAALGLVAAPTLLLLLVGWAGLTWLRYGRDPVYLDDPSILMPAPPPDLTAASGALVRDGRSSRHTLTTALLDLASRGELAFREEEAPRSHKRVGIELRAGDADPALLRARRRPISKAEEYLLIRLRTIARDEGGYLDPDDLEEFSRHVATFDDRLESHVVRKGWFRERPVQAIRRWRIRATIELIAGVVAGGAGVALPSQGLLLVGGAAIAAGLITFALAPAMPSRTMPGAMIHAMLAAYRRTLQKTLHQARSMREVVDSNELPWLETPDQAVVWGVALGLQDEVQKVLERSLEDLRERRAEATSAWVPSWYGSAAGFTGAGSTSPGPASGTAGLFSSSALPNLGGMMAALGTIGATPGASGAGGGGFSGGSSGGGGGGSGGGF